MSMVAEQRSMGNMTDNYVGYDELEPQAIVYDARSMPRATAIRAFCAETGDAFPDVKCETRYARWMTRAEQWDEFGQERWAEKLIDEYPGDAKWSDGAWRDMGTGALIGHLFEPPDEPPADWEPGEYEPSWEFCDKTAEGAIKVYLCAAKDRS